mmetsp:Transcript_2842/g.7357  ORF Transcript_2842/g.7357 Transcript_2842/m.7357 type:complete len:227 (-) Transcript_2842:1446-2126(-)
MVENTGCQRLRGATPSQHSSTGPAWPKKPPRPPSKRMVCATAPKLRARRSRRLPPSAQQRCLASSAASIVRARCSSPRSCWASRNRSARRPARSWTRRSPPNEFACGPQARRLTPEGVDSCRGGGPDMNRVVPALVGRLGGGLAVACGRAAAHQRIGDLERPRVSALTEAAAADRAVARVAADLDLGALHDLAVVGVDAHVHRRLASAVADGLHLVHFVGQGQQRG